MLSKTHEDYSCFQKDIFNIVYLSESLHLYEVADYWRAIIEMNDYQKLRFTKRILSCLFHNLFGKKIAVLGFAFKKDTSDTRESPAITLVRNFVDETAQVAIYDPQVKEQQIWTELVNDGGDLRTLKKRVVICDSAYDACACADAVVVVTEWDEFSNKTDTAMSAVDGPVAVASTFCLQEINPNRGSQSGLPLSPDKLADKRTRTSISPSPPNRRKENRECATIPSIAERLDRKDFLAKPASAKPPLDWARVAKGMRRPKFVFDGRGVLDATKLEKLGLRVEAIGRASTVLRDST